MADVSVCLATVAVGAAYERYAGGMEESAREFFRPSEEVSFVCLPGTPGWPAATLYRYHAILEAARRGWLDADYVFLIDADMLFENPVGEEILAATVATVHPGYVGRSREELPYERRTFSTAAIALSEGETYFAGGFVGGERTAFLSLAAHIVEAIEEDTRRGITAVWHDESHLNRALIYFPPALALSPSYCYPDDASRYIWPEPYERRIVALDKTPAERIGR
jgi:hypothetical protein